MKPNQILVSDYNECVNNTKETFGENTDKYVKLDTLEVSDYIQTKKEELLLDNIRKTFESFGFNVNIYSENGIYNQIEIESWTDGGVDMVETIYFNEVYQDIYDAKKIDKELQNIVDNFSVDEEIDLHREGQDYKNAFSIRESLEDFESYYNKLKDSSKNFLNKYHELIFEKVMKDNLIKEDSISEINY